MGKISRGSIRCNKCGIAMKEGVCPKCNGIRCHINIYWQQKVYKFYRDTSNIELSQLSAIAMLSEINREMADEHRPFYITKWSNVSCRQRLVTKAVDSWILDCEEEVKRGEMSLSVPIFYRSIAKTHFLNEAYGIGKQQIEKVGVFEIRQFSKSLPSNLKISSRRTIMNTLHVFFNWCYREGLISFIPAFPTIKGNDSKPRIALSIQDQHEAFQRLPEYCRDVFIFESETGLRPGETCALKIKDFNFTDRVLSVRRTFTAHHLRESDKEGHKKPIPLSDAALQIAKVRSGERFPEDWLFLNPQGKHYTQQNLNDIWRRYSGVDCTHYESTRHSFCSQIAEIDDETAAQGLMRHVCKSSTQRYIHNRTEYLRDALTKRGNVVELKKMEKK